MKMPRVRFTIGRLMIAVLVAAVALWGMSVRRSIRENRQAQAAYHQAMLVREVAEYALKEYKEGIYPQERATYLGQIALAKSDRDRAADRLERSSRMRERGFIKKPFLVADQLSRQKADFDLEQAQMQLEVLEKYTRDKTIKSLQSDIEKARADEQAKLASWKMQQARRWRVLGF